MTYNGNERTGETTALAASRGRTHRTRTISLGSGEGSGVNQVTAGHSVFSVVRDYPRGTGRAPSIGHGTGTTGLWSPQPVIVLGVSRFYSSTRIGLDVSPA